MLMAVTQNQAIAEAFLGGMLISICLTATIPLVFLICKELSKKDKK